MSTTEAIDLQPWCDNGKHPRTARYNLDKPFFQGGWQCASNGCWVIRVRADGERDSAGTFPRLDDIFVRYAAEAFEPLPLDLVPDMLVQECPACEGSGYHHTKDCLDCDGDGSVECPECGHEDDCDRCDGVGSIGCGKCKACDGSKRFEQPHSVDVAGRFINARIYKQLIALPSIEYAATDGAVVFRFDGGQAVVMEMVKE